jgi:hypothetical protein
MPGRECPAAAFPIYRVLILAFAVCMISCTPPLRPQAQPEPESALTVPRESPAGRLIAEAEAADTGEGLQAYTRHLAKYFVFQRRLGVAYVDAFSQRLLAAELMARQGKRKWIPESMVAQAFNGLMNQAAGSSAKPYQTDVSVVHQMRLILHGVSPHFSSVDTHSSECLPSEAVLIMWQLLLQNGIVSPPNPPVVRCVPPCVVEVDADILMVRYIDSHTRRESVALYDHVAQLFGF